MRTAIYVVAIYFIDWCEKIVFEITNKKVSVVSENNIETFEHLIVFLLILCLVQDVREIFRKERR